MTYELKPLSCDPAKLTGLSEKLIVSHWENNYGGAVKRLNAIEQQLAQLTGERRRCSRSTASSARR
jgi:Fe-Mn family superoxide dismutase